MGLTVKQIEYVRNADRRWNIKIGATRSGKTFLDYSTVIPKRILQTSGEGLLVIMGYTQQTIERNLLEPMRALWGEQLIGNIVSGRNTVRMFGRTVHALGADKLNAVSRLRGTGIEYCYGDEVPTWNAEVFELLKSRLDRPNSVFDGTGNPEGPAHWFKKFIDSDIDAYIQHYTIDDNPTLDPRFVENLKREYAGTVYYDRYILGLWRVAEGAVYPMFDTTAHVVDEVPARYYQLVVGVDYGHSNPTVFLLCGIAEDGKMYIIDEDIHKEGDALASVDHSPREYSQGMIRFLRKHNDLLTRNGFGGIVVDPSAKGFINQLRADGVARVRAAQNDVIPGIQMCSSIISSDSLRVHRRCQTTIEEMQSYVWDTAAQARGIDKPLKRGDHCMDAFRYVAMGWKNEWRGLLKNAI